MANPVYKKTLVINKNTFDDNVVSFLNALSLINDDEDVIRIKYKIDEKNMQVTIDMEMVEYGTHD